MNTNVWKKCSPSNFFFSTKYQQTATTNFGVLEKLLSRRSKNSSKYSRNVHLAHLLQRHLNRYFFIWYYGRDRLSHFLGAKDFPFYRIEIVRKGEFVEALDSNFLVYLETSVRDFCGRCFFSTFVPILVSGFFWFHGFMVLSLHFSRIVYWYSIFLSIGLLSV